MTEKKLEETIIFVLADSINVERLVVADLFDPLATVKLLNIKKH